MASKDGQRPIIVKKVKKVAGGHHGGAWKVAYADFVTAMMAFFLLLWLLSTSSKATLEGLSEYFTPTQGIKDSQGIGFKGGISADVDGTAKSTKSQPGVVTGQTPSGVVADNPDIKSDTESEAEDNLFRDGGKAVDQAFTQDKELSQYQENISTTQTPEGLRIDITDTDKYAMFDRGNAELTEHGQKIMARIVTIIKKMPNYMAIYGHTDASPTEAGKQNYTNWELSSDRAQAARRFMLKSGMEPERPKKIIGMADKELFTPNEPRGPKNRRISIVLMRGSHILIPDAAIPAPSEGQPHVASPKAMPQAPQASH